MALNKPLLLFLLFLLGYYAHAQEHYFFISFKDKNLQAHPSSFLSVKALKRRARQKIVLHENDYPVTQSYVHSIVKGDTKLLFASKWLNGVVVSTSNPKTLFSSTFDFVSDIKTIGSNKTAISSRSGLTETFALDSYDYGNALHQVQSMGINAMHDMGLNGQGIYVAVFDGGFERVNSQEAFFPLFTDNRIKFTYNIVGRKPNVYERHTHGTNVLSCLGAYSPGNLIGTGFGADFALFITEDVSSEKLIEEYNWLRAAEMADSIGVDIISSSLGYNFFDDPAENHTLDQLDGKTAVITRAAQMAARKGILVVSSAGNNYADAKWRSIVFPNDGDSVLSVGAVDMQGRKASFSAIGPTTDGRIKPDVSAFGTGVIVHNSDAIFSAASGTSYSAPLVAGLAASLWQYDTSLTNIQLKEYIKQSGSLFCNPTNSIGYGIPLASTALFLIKNRKNLECAFRPSGIFPNPAHDAIYLYASDIITVNDLYYVYDVNGKEVIRGTIETAYLPKIKIDTSNLKAGIYFLKVLEKSYKLIKL